MKWPILASWPGLSLNIMQFIKIWNSFYIFSILHFPSFLPSRCHALPTIENCAVAEYSRFKIYINAFCAVFGSSRFDMYHVFTHYVATSYQSEVTEYVKAGGECATASTHLLCSHSETLCSNLWDVQNQ